MDSSNSIVITGGSRLSNIQTLTNSSLVNASLTKVTVRKADEFKDETFNNGSTYAKWLSKIFVFENQCDGVEVKLNCIFYNNTDIKMFYKTRTVGFDGDFSKVNWVPFNPNTVLTGENKTDDSGNLIKTPGLPNNVESIKARTSFNTNPKNILPDDWQTLVWNTQDLAKFDAIAVKIVMTSSNAALVPIIDDLQMIVSE